MPLVQCLSMTLWEATCGGLLWESIDLEGMLDSSPDGRRGVVCVAFFAAPQQIWGWRSNVSRDIGVS
jgi:hypothetical protein